MENMVKSRIIDRLVLLLMSGKSIDEACDDINVDKKTLCLWFLDDVALYRLFVAARSYALSHKMSHNNEGKKLTDRDKLYLLAQAAEEMIKVQSESIKKAREEYKHSISEGGAMDSDEKKQNDPLVDSNDDYIDDDWDDDDDDDDDWDDDEDDRCCNCDCEDYEKSAVYIDVVFNAPLFFCGLLGDMDSIPEWLQKYLNR